MKYIFSLFRFEYIKKELLDVQKRFPLSLGITILFTLLLFCLLHGEFSSATENIIVRSLFSSIIMFFLTTGLSLLLEESKVSSEKKHIFSSLGIVFGFFFFLGFDIDSQSFQSVIYFFITLCGILAFLFFAPFVQECIQQDIPQKKYYHYFYKVSIVFLLSVILGGVLFGLGAIAIGSVTLLFDLDFPSLDKLYADWAIISLGLFTPLFALTQLPEKRQLEDLSVHSFFAFLVKFVALPFILLYFIILYAYSIKVLLNFSDWPKGEVSWLVIGFSSFGYIIYIFSYIFEKDISLVKYFRKYFPYMVLPQTAMLFYAIYLRVAQYDVTINRYFVIVFGLWLVCISLYYIFSQKRFLAVVPAVITCFTLLISLGPWSVYQLPENRQLKRLEANLVLAGILEGENIIILQNATDIDPQLSGEIFAGISYFCNWNDCSSLKKLFPEQYAEILIEHRKEFDAYTKNLGEDDVREYEEPQSWHIMNSLTAKLKVQQYYPDSSGQTSYISYSKNYSDRIFPLEVSGYDTLLQIQGAQENSSENEIVYNIQTRTLNLVSGEITLESFSLDAFFTELQKKYTQGYNENIPGDEMTVSLSGVNYDAIVYLENIHLQTSHSPEEENRKYAWETINGYLLLKKK